MDVAVDKWLQPLKPAGQAHVWCGLDSRPSIEKLEVVVPTGTTWKEEDPVQIVKLRSTGEWVIVPDRPRQSTSRVKPTVPKVDGTQNSKERR